MNAAAKDVVTEKTRVSNARVMTAVKHSRRDPSADSRGAMSYQVTQPVLFKRQSMLVAVILSLRAATPAAVSSLTLYGLSQAFGLPTTEFLSALTVLVTVLSIVLLQSSG